MSHAGHEDRNAPNRTITRAEFTVALPHGARGSKYINGDLHAAGTAVVSRMGRVDRNDQRDEDKTSANSHAPRGARGSKDLIGFSCHAFIPVAPMQGAWIEIP